MNRKVAGQGRKHPGRRRFGWGAALGFVLAIAGVTLLLIVLLIAVAGTSWLPVYGEEAEALPPLISRTAPVLAPAPTSEAIILPTPLPDDYFASAAVAPPSGFGDLDELEPLALLPESPGNLTPRDEQKPTGDRSLASGDQAPRLEIAAIGLDAPIQSVDLMEMEDNGRSFYQWQVPSAYAVGWHVSSAEPGSPGNTVLNGHNNVHGAVFRDLLELEMGDEIIVYEGEQKHLYQVAHREVLEEKDQPLEVRLDNAKWMLPTADERLTLITCWPYASATHRVIVVATPVDGG